MRRRAAAAALLGLALPVAARAQDVGRDGYRTGVPGVLTPPRPQRPPETPFQTAYRRAGYPRLVLFFNREIADAASSGPVVQQREGITRTESGQLHGQVTGAPASGAQRTDAQADKFEATPVQNEPPRQPPASGDRSIDMQSQSRVEVQRNAELTVTRPSIGGRRAPVPEAQQWLFESGFNNRLGGEGARLVDRATAMRLSAGLRLDDPQRLETAALRGFAEVALVVRAAPLDANARADDIRGLVFRVTAIDTRNGELLADAVVPPPEAAGADPASAAGDATAGTLMARLTQRWTPRQ